MFMCVTNHKNAERNIEATNWNTVDGMFIRPEEIKIIYKNNNVQVNHV